MAEKLTLDDGVLELDINGNGLLRFNPSDPNLYKRFVALADELPEMQERYAVEESGEELGELDKAGVVLDGLDAMDREVKERLSIVFGLETDFDKLLGGVNLMATGRNGQFIVTNLFAALLPYLEEGAQRCRKATADEAVTRAKSNRAARRAK